MDLFDLPEDPKKAAIDWAKTGKMLMLMAQMGGPREMLLALLSFGAGKALTSDHENYFMGPILVNKSHFHIEIPEWMMNAIPAARLGVIINELEKGEGPGWQVSPLEIAIAYHRNTFDAPMGHEPSEVYIWSSACSIRDYKPDQYPALEASFGDSLPRDDQVIDKKGRYYYTYHEMTRGMRPKIIERAKAEKRLESKELPRGKPDKDDPDEGFIPFQLEIF